MNATWETCQLEKNSLVYSGEGEEEEKTNPLPLTPEKTNGLVQESTTYR